MITVSIVEDSLDFSKVLSQRIDEQTDMQCISNYSKVDKTTSELLNDNPDVVIMDINLSDTQSGVDLVKELKQKDFEGNIIMCTSFDDDDNVFQSLLNGALGYILKSDELTDILNAIREVMVGGSPMSMPIARKVIHSFNQKGGKGNDISELSKRENELLQLLAQGLLYKEAAVEMNISIETVKKHAHNIYKKLQVNNKIEAINKLKNN